jgi:Asp-tRNA(Asn)/Glu-tRNA(Gln) amidotransferase A subunit family amidase
MTTHSANSDLYFSTARELRAKFDAREISSVEATRTMLDRITALEPKLNSFITVTAERAISKTTSRPKMSKQQPLRIF